MDWEAGQDVQFVGVPEHVEQLVSQSWQVLSVINCLGPLQVTQEDGEPEHEAQFKSHSWQVLSFMSCLGESQLVQVVGVP